MGAFKEVSRIAGAFVGVIVGAGFASGQEILQFFAGFGAIGLAGCLVAALAFVFLSMAFSTIDRKSTRLNSSHLVISYAVFCLKKKNNKHIQHGLRACTCHSR